MPVYAYEGKNQSGEASEGEVVAPDSKEAVRMLRKRQVAVTRLREQGIPRGATKSWVPGALVTHVKSRDVVTMTLQCATMLKSGIHLLQCVEVLSAHSESPILQRILTEVHRDIETGRTLGEALGRHPKVFPRFYVNMVEVGEATGGLDAMLARLADHMERIATVRRRIFSALAYPLTLFVLAFIVLFFMLIWIVPLFSRCLPSLTRPSRG